MSQTPSTSLSPDRLSRALQALAALAARDPELSLGRLATAPGSVYLEKSCALLRGACGLDYALLASGTGEDWSVARTHVAEGPEGRMPDFEYDLADTPCMDVLEGRACVFRRDVAKLFPSDALLRELGVEGYVGWPILEESGRPLGLLVGLSREPLDEETEQVALAVMELLSERLHAILEHRHLVREHRDLLEIGARPTHMVFSELVEQLARKLGVRHGFVVVPEGREGLRVLRSYRDGAQEPDFAFLRRGTPFNDLGEDEELFCPSALAKSYPDEPWLGLLGAESLWLRRLISREGKPLGFFGVAHDRPLRPGFAESPLLGLFAERFQTELARRQAEEERRATEQRWTESRHHESLSMFAGGIAHDFNNLLTGIVGQVEFARVGLSPAHQAQDHLERALDTAERAGQLCRHLLGYAGRRALERVDVDLRRIVEDLVGALCSATDSRLSVQLRLGEDALPVRVDPEQFRIALDELLRHTDAALRAGRMARSGGVGRFDLSRPRMTLQLDRVELSSEELLAPFAGARLRPGVHARLRLCSDEVAALVQLEGEALQERLQDPYFTTKIGPRRDGASGLGLAAVLGIARKHEAALRVIELDSEESGFELYLPLAPQIVSRAPAPELELARGCGQLLVVDDEEVVREVAALGLANHGYEVTTASSGEEALSLLGSSGASYDLVLLDFKMPGGLDGLEVIEKLRSEGRELPIVLMSGLLGSEMRQRVASYRGVTFLEKPFRRAQLLELVARQLTAS
jgi:CheY-like chemotaxis protein